LLFFFFQRNKISEDVLFGQMKRGFKIIDLSAKIQKRTLANFEQTTKRKKNHLKSVTALNDRSKLKLFLNSLLTIF